MAQAGVEVLVTANGDGLASSGVLAILVQHRRPPSPT